MTKDFFYEKNNTHWQFVKNIETLRQFPFSSLLLSLYPVSQSAWLKCLIWNEIELIWRTSSIFWTFRFPVELENPGLDLGLQEISPSCLSQGYSKIQGQGLYLEIGLQNSLFTMMKNVQTKPNGRRDEGLLALLNHLLPGPIPWRTLFLSCKQFVPHCHLAQPASAP